MPWPFCEITGEYLPAETGQVDRAVNIHKGCYLGQEVVERMRSRGALARKLVGLTLQGDEAVPTPVALVKADGTPVGQLTSSQRSFTLGKVIGLGYVKTASASVGASLQATCGDRRVDATVTDLPFVPGTAS